MTYFYSIVCSLQLIYVHAGSLVRPKVTRSVHYCPSTKKVLERKYTDLTSFDPFPASSVYPTQVLYTFLIFVIHGSDCLDC